MRQRLFHVQGLPGFSFLRNPILSDEHHGGRRSRVPLCAVMLRAIYFLVLALAPACCLLMAKEEGLGRVEQCCMNMPCHKGTLLTDTNRPCFWGLLYLLAVTSR